MMIAAAHVIPLAGVEHDREPGRRGTGIANAALTTVDALGEPADLVLVAVPAGRGAEFVGHVIRVDVTVYE